MIDSKGAQKEGTYGHFLRDRIVHISDPAQKGLSQLFSLNRGKSGNIN